jgi:hypothetical protein
MRARFEHNGQTISVDGRYYFMSMKPCQDEDCAACTAIEWDWDGSIETLGRDASGTVAILDPEEKGGPFSWSVSGTGFTLDEAETVGLTNTLNADNTSCGKAEITVIGCNEIPITGSVRSTEGKWDFAGAEYPCNFTSGACGITEVCLLIQGGYYYTAYCGCCTACENSAHPCAIPEGCTPNGPDWNNYCLADTCYQQCGGSPEYITRWKVRKAAWICS